MDNLCLHNTWTDWTSIFKQAVVTEDDMTKQNDFFLGIIDAEFHNCLGNFAINQSDMSKKIASDRVLGLVWSRQLDDLSQVVQHNPRIEQALIELRINFANSVCQTHHGRRMIGQARFKGMVVGLGSWIE